MREIRPAREAAMHPPRVLLELQVEALFVHGAAGRIVRTNEPSSRRAPRFFLARSADGNLWRVRDDLPADLIAELDRVARAEPVRADPGGEPDGATAVRHLLADHAPVTSAGGGPAYVFPDAPPAGPGTDTGADVRLIGPGDLDLTRETFPWMEEEIAGRQPCAVAVLAGRAVAACFCARRSARAAEAGVDTLEAYRRRGYAAAVTRAWGEAVRREGLVPLYSTSWDNLASQGVARRLGLVRYGADWSAT
jgi:hypothetical protein